jgi:hypothetical protein
MNRADRIIRRYLFIDINSLFANAERAFLFYRTKVQQFGETNGVAEKKNDVYPIAVEIPIKDCLDSHVEHSG